MTTIERTAMPTRAPVDPTRKTALIAGVLYLITFAASIPALFLLSPVLDRSDYIVSAGSDTQVLLGCFLDVVTPWVARRRTGRDTGRRPVRRVPRTAGRAHPRGRPASSLARSGAPQRSRHRHSIAIHPTRTFGNRSSRQAPAKDTRIDVR
jgi:hypothetical protein